MSALRPIADMCDARAHVRYGPIADTRGRNCVSAFAVLYDFFEIAAQRLGQVFDLGVG